MITHENTFWFNSTVLLGQKANSGKDKLHPAGMFISAGNVQFICFIKLYYYLSWTVYKEVFM